MENKIRFLVDSNIWLERLLEQDKTSIVSEFLDIIPLDSLYVSDFSIHSIGVVLTRLNKNKIFESFIEDLFINGQLEQLQLDPIDLLEVIKNMIQYGFDFDDSYQFTVASKYDLKIVTFDKDFKKKGIKRYSPEEAIRLLK
jgi:uncharacterized protein